MAGDIIKKSKKLHQMISSANSIAIIGHIHPDGDCIGAVTALKRYIKSKFEDKQVTITVPTPFPDFLTFLDPNSEILIHKNSPDAVRNKIEECDLMICMDLGKPSRTENMENLVRECAARKILIDHHLDPEDFTNLTFSFMEVSSTCEITYWLLTECSEGKPLEEDVMEGLCTGLLTDTNNFSNSLFPSTFLMASQLIETGFRIDRIQDLVLNSYSQDRMRLMGQMLLAPNTRGGLLLPDYVDSERDKLIEMIRARLNDKLSYYFR